MFQESKWSDFRSPMYTVDNFVALFFFYSVIWCEYSAFRLLFIWPSDPASSQTWVWGDRPSRPSPAHSLIKKLTSHASCFPLPTTTHRYLLLPHFVLHLEGRSCYSIWVHIPPYTESSRRICGLWVQLYLPVFSFLFHFLYKF